MSVRASFTNSEFGPRQSLDHWKWHMAITLARSRQFNLNEILYQNNPHGSRVMISFTFLEFYLGKASTDDKPYLAIPLG